MFNLIMKKRIEAAEISFLRRMLRISWTKMKRNDEVLEMVEYGRSLQGKKEKGKVHGACDEKRRN